ncbi:MAG: hypothetical protein KF761_04890 [Salinibacterium sp.]|nr:hypothetical protein [Salinibacterium sp.]
MTSFDVKRKRAWWFAWIPAAITLVLIVAIGTTSAVLLNQGLGTPLPKPTVGQVTELNWSSFSAEGIDYIEKSRRVRIDFARPPVQAAAIDLIGDGATTIGPSFHDDTDNDYYLIINGGGEGHGGTWLTVSELTVTSKNGLVTGIAALASGALPFRDALALLQGHSEEFGWAPPDMTALFAEVEDATRAGTSYEFTFGPGDRLGFDISATASCESTGFCVVQYDAAPRVG